MTVGILGMAFKGGSDDIRSCLSYKLKRILAFKADAVLCTDPYVTVDAGPAAAGRGARAGPTCWSSPRRTPSTASLVTDKPVADIWNLLGQGVTGMTS